MPGAGMAVYELARISGGHPETEESGTLGRTADSFALVLARTTARQESARVSRFHGPPNRATHGRSSTAGGPVFGATFLMRHGRRFGQRQVTVSLAASFGRHQWPFDAPNVAQR